MSSAFFRVSLSFYFDRTLFRPEVDGHGEESDEEKRLYNIPEYCGPRHFIGLLFAL
jgi:hypothetical protein